MELTIHGGVRIQGRTKMLAKDVLSVVASGAVVELGAAHGFEYLLFYSPPDRGCKVAVVSEGRTHLVSIWEVDFNLPQGVKPATQKRKKKARLALQALLFRRMPRPPSKEKKTKPIQVPVVPHYLVKIEVEVEDKVQFVHEVGIHSAKEAKNLYSIIGLLRPQLETIVSTIQAHREMVGDRSLAYNISFWRNGRFVKQHHIRHDTLLGYFQAAK